MQQIQTILRGKKKQVCIEEQCVYWTIICIKRGNDIQMLAYSYSYFHSFANIYIVLKKQYNF